MNLDMPSCHIYYCDNNCFTKSGSICSLVSEPAYIINDLLAMG